VDNGERTPIRRRSETRRRLLAAAATLFERSGTISQRVEDICAQAGFTRGAFYSNFTGVDQLYLALHEEQAAKVWERLHLALDAQAGEVGREETLDDAVRVLLDAMPAGREWFSLRSVLLARAAADPAFAERMMIDDGRAARDLGERFVALAAVHGRVPVVEASVLAKAVVAAHVGTVSQWPVDAGALLTQRLTIAAVLRGLTVEAAAASPAGAGRPGTR
jgi:AcrR family transcriptional regulator